MSSASSSTRPSTASTPLTSYPITPSETKEGGGGDDIVSPLHALWCFEVLVAHFESREPCSPPFKTTDDESYALFVTWKTDKGSRGGKHVLRGCIGTFSPLPLTKGLKKYALISALEDHRFSPIKRSELPHLSIHLSLLTPFQPISDPLDWIPGQHGIYITFPDPSHPDETMLNATFLPEIAPEQGWSKEETILHAIQKAGWRGRVRVGDEVWRSLRVKVYESKKVGVEWEDYVRWKEQGEGEE